MQGLAWLGFVIGLGLLLITGSSVIKTLLIPRNLTMRSIAGTLGIEVSHDPHPDDPPELTRDDFDEAVQHLAEAKWTFERPPDQAWPHFRGWRVNYEAAADIAPSPADTDTALRMSG